MKALFCHDGPISCDSKSRYYSIGFNDRLLSRYEKIFGNISFITRVERKENYSEMEKISTDRFKIIEYPDYLNFKGIFRNKTKSDNILKKEILKNDLLIIRLPSFLGSKCIKIAKEYNKPYLIELVGCPWDSLRNHGITGKILAPYMYLLTKYQVKTATDVLYVTDKFLQKRYPTKGNEIGCSDVELQSITSFFRKSEDKNIKNKNIVIGTIGKIDLIYKGQETVIKAMKILMEEGYDIQYQIVGPGNKNYLKNIAKELKILDKVCFIGVLSHEQIFDWLDKIDLYIQPSLTEGMPRSLIEAMSRGCPCIASNAGGMPELLEEKFIFKKGNEKQLAQIILESKQNQLFNQSKRNTEFVKKFLAKEINEKRKKFYEEFRNRLRSK
ncbi:MAG: glycosyltransferase [Fusobacterium sp.]|uniref:glycosyltransferase n=1 Tax=Fusobacterium sp. TaxID=68766 RepID=UPI002A750359|nr:glycosyltransferase [Fusobacterium sp.]MDY2980881.1 glycosyltransferase [Fusobacterium sp.]